MSTVKIDCSVLKDTILEIATHYCNNNRIVEHITTSLVENGVVDETWGHLMYSEDGNYLPGGMDIDKQILDQLEEYVTSLV